ncbi:hypothetical protein GCM10010230_19250 [Streptomyces narbonensis]|nr:hypothetical protein GCM10010230_19250 [Streptomyces narbonensis]
MLCESVRIEPEMARTVDRAEDAAAEVGAEADVDMVTPRERAGGGRRKGRGRRSAPHLDEEEAKPIGSVCQRNGSVLTVN